MNTAPREKSKTLLFLLRDDLWFNIKIVVTTIRELIAAKLFDLNKP